MRSWTIRTRIIAAMTLVLATMAVTVVACWALLLRAEAQAVTADEALREARVIQTASERLDRFIASSNDLAFAVSMSDNPELVSMTYGDVFGIQEDVDHALRRMQESVSDPRRTRDASTQWELLRLSTFVYVNSEAEASGSPLRWRKMPDGEYRGGTEGNLRPPRRIAGLSAGQLRTEVRRQGQVLRDATLRGMVIRAENKANEARQASQDASKSARVIVIVLLLVDAIVAGAASVWLYRTIARPLHAARDYADAVRAGDYDAPVPPASRDEVGALTEAIAAMTASILARVDTLREIAGVVLITAEGIETSSRHALRHTGRHSTDRTGNADHAVIDLHSIATQSALLKDLANDMMQS